MIAASDQARQTAGVTESRVLHLLPLADYRQAGGRSIEPPSLASEGFVHCSPDIETTLAVANSLYRDADQPMVALELDTDLLDSPLRWEKPSPAPPAGMSDAVLFPHVYGPLRPSAVSAVHYARRSLDGRYVSLEKRSPTAETLDLLPHPEGGWFRRTYTSPQEVVRSGSSTARPTATAIYFLLNPSEQSAWHTVASDELWLWHRGGTLALSLGGSGEHPTDPQPVTVGPDIGAGQSPQMLVPAGTWQRAEADQHRETLVTCVVSPGFDFADFRVLPS